MRIIAGKLGGRQFDSPKNTRTHPMSDKMRGALFNTLGDIVGLTVLDAFAGSGALGLEALSRGASQATFIEQATAAQQTIARNIAALNLQEQTELCNVSVSTWIKANPSRTFDILLCDPPYDDIQQPMIEQLTNHVTVNGLFIVSWPGSLDPPTFATIKQLSQKKYGDGQLVFYRRIS
jgi:16S rRNA (guanine966-N2)-methyltransferase